MTDSSYDPNWGGLANDDSLPPPTSFGLMDFQEQPSAVVTPAVVTPSQPQVVQASIATVIATPVAAASPTPKGVAVDVQPTSAETRQQDKDAAALNEALGDNDKFPITAMKIFLMKPFQIVCQIINVICICVFTIEAAMTVSCSMLDALYPFYDLIAWTYWPLLMFFGLQNFGLHFIKKCLIALNKPEYNYKTDWYFMPEIWLWGSFGAFFVAGFVSGRFAHWFADSWGEDCRNIPLLCVSAALIFLFVWRQIAYAKWVTNVVKRIEPKYRPFIVWVYGNEPSRGA